MAKIVDLNPIHRCFKYSIFCLYLLFWVNALTIDLINTASHHSLWSSCLVLVSPNFTSHCEVQLICGVSKKTPSHLDVKSCCYFNNFIFRVLNVISLCEYAAFGCSSNREKRIFNSSRVTIWWRCSGWWSWTSPGVRFNVPRSQISQMIGELWSNFDLLLVLPGRTMGCVAY